MSKFNNALFQYYRSLPFGQLVNWQDLKFLHIVNQMIFHFHQKNGLCSKISFFKNNELKTEVFKQKIFALLYRLSQVKERNEPFPLIDTIIHSSRCSSNFCYNSYSNSSTSSK